MRIPFKRRKGAYVGPVAFVDGAHYPVDGNGQAILKQRLLWDANAEQYNWAKPSDPTHFHLYHQRFAELVPE